MFTGPIAVSLQDIREQSSAQVMALGSLAETRDGRKYRYAKAGASALTPGTMNQQPAIVAAHLDMVTAAAAVGASSVTVTLGATAVVRDYYAEGYLFANDNTGQGLLYAISGHDLDAGSTTLVINLSEPIIVALDATSQTSLMANKFKEIVITANAATMGGVPVGVSNIDVTAKYFGWVQTSGPCALLCDSTVFTLGEEVSAPASAVAGSGSLKVATIPTFGHAMQLGVSGEYQIVDLTLE